MKLLSSKLRCYEVTLLPLQSSIQQISLFPVVTLGLGQLSSVIHRMIPRLMHISWGKKQKTKKHNLLAKKTNEKDKTTSPGHN